jgi:hypothetical protein
MKLSDTAAAAARLALVNDKTRKAFEEQLSKWFVAHFVKGASLSLVRSVHQAGAYDAFAQLLVAATDAERTIILAKIDKYRPEIQMRSTAEKLEHLEELASGRAAPASKPKPPTKPKAAKASKAPVTIIPGSKYGSKTKK